MTNLFGSFLSMFPTGTSTCRDHKSSNSQTSTKLVTTVVLAAIPLCIIIKKYIFNKRPKYSYPPGPPGVFFFGNTLDFPDGGGFIDDKFLEWSLKYGLVYTISVPFVGKMIICADPELVKLINVSRNYPKSSTYQILTPVIGTRSMVVVEGDERKKMRKAFNPGFSLTFLKGMTSTMNEKMERFLDCIEDDINDNAPTHMLTRAQTFTSDVIVSIAFGEDWGGKDPHPAREWETELCHSVNGILFSPGKLLFGFRLKQKIRHYEKLLDEEMHNILERQLAAGISEQSKDICSIAINCMKGPDGSLTEEDKNSIADQLKTFYFAGHDTTAILISWSVWLLSWNDDVLAKVRAKLKENGIGSSSARPSTYDQLQRCTYLEAVLKETLRLYPPASGSRATKDANATYNGYAISNAILVSANYVMHRHPSLWKRPNEFIPERFLDGSEDNLTAKFNPFSRGPRDCIGKYFALS